MNVLDRRDLERVLRHLLHAAHRDDIKVEVKFYVQFAIDDDGSAQTLVDPWQPFPRSSARTLVSKAIETLDKEEAKSVQEEKARETISTKPSGVLPRDAENPSPAGSTTVAGATEASPEIPIHPAEVSQGVVL
jgi:hypothetical protein